MAFFVFFRQFFFFFSAGFNQDWFRVRLDWMFFPLGHWQFGVGFHIGAFFEVLSCVVSCVCFPLFYGMFLFNLRQETMRFGEAFYI